MKLIIAALENQQVWSCQLFTIHEFEHHSKKKKKDFWFFQEDVTAKKSQLKLSRGKFCLSVPDDEMIRASCLAAYADGSFAEELDNVKRTQSPRIEMYYVVL